MPKGFSPRDFTSPPKKLQRAANVGVRLLLEGAAEFGSIPAGLLGFTPIRQKIAQEERRQATLLARLAFETLGQLIAERPVVVPGVGGDSEPPVDPELLAAAISANANRDTGAMADSIRVNWTGSEYEVRSPGIPYMRIQNWGGMTGKNHASLLAGHFFVEKGAAEVGVDRDLVTIPEDFDV